MQKCFETVVDRCLPPPFDVSWKYEPNNYILETLKYEKQRDLNSCGAYIKLAVAECVRPTECMPNDTFSSEHYF